MKINCSINMEISSEEVTKIVELDRKYSHHYISNDRRSNYSSRRERVNYRNNDNVNDRRSNYCHHDQSEIGHQPTDSLYKFKVNWPSYKRAIDKAIAEDDQVLLHNIMADLTQDSKNLRDYLNK